MNWHGRTELGHDSRWHPPLPTKGTGPSQTHSPRGDQSPVVWTYLLALHALRTSWANAP